MRLVPARPVPPLRPRQVYPKADWAPRVFRAKTTFEGMARTVGGSLFPFGVDPAGARAARSSATWFGRSAGYDAYDVFSVTPPRPDRRPLAPDPVPGLKTLSGGRHQYQGRPGASMAHSLEVREPLMDHPWSNGWRPCPPASRFAARKANTCSRRRWNPTCRTTCSTVPKWALVPLGARWFRRPLKGTHAQPSSARGWPKPGWFNRNTSSHLVSAIRQKGRGLQPSLWTLLMFKAFRNVAEDQPRKRGGGGMRVLHVLDHSIPLHSGYTSAPCRSREQRKLRLKPST